jgi:hypothetical protein
MAVIYNMTGKSLAAELNVPDSHTSVLLCFNGTSLECMMPREAMEKRANEGIKQLLTKHSVAFLKVHMLKLLKEMEADLYERFPDGYDVQKVAKYWGKDALQNFLDWHYGIIFLLKTKVIQNDNENGCLEITAPKSNTAFREISTRKLFQKCSNCQEWGNYKHCSGCKKVHYCSAECQKAHWKTHKPDCHC